MPSLWLSAAHRVDLSATHGDGPRTGPFLGVVAHVNQSNGNLANFFRNSTNVCPNFQVYKDGSVEQYLPMNFHPWCQSDGNANYDAIETEGLNTEPWTIEQLDSVGLIYAAYHAQFGIPLALADSPGQHGFGWHGMGGNAWGGHPDCPGPARKAQRQQVLTLIAAGEYDGGGTEDDMAGLNDGDLTNVQEYTTAQSIDVHNVDGPDLAPGATWPPPTTLRRMVADTLVRQGRIESKLDQIIAAQPK